MNSNHIFKWLAAILMVAFVSCQSEDDLKEEIKYYLIIQSQVSLNLSDDDENQGTMANSDYDVMSKTISRMKQVILETESQSSGENKDAAIMEACDNIYKEYEEYASSQDLDLGKTICFVKIMRSSTINGVTQGGASLKTYFFHAIRNAEPDVPDAPTPPTFNIEKPETLEMVDLGLSVLWANCNLGADSPEKYGGYFAWGDSTGALWSGEGINHLSDGYSWNTDNYGGKTPPAEIGGTDLDIVTVHWGDGWRTPSGIEAYELCSQCQWLLHNENGHKWYDVIGPNGNSIIIPLGGMYTDSNNSATRFMVGPMYSSMTGYYWTSTSCDTPSSAESRGYGVKRGVVTAWTFICASSRGDLTGKNMFLDHLRAFHMSIRPVHDK